MGLRMSGQCTGKSPTQPIFLASKPVVSHQPGAHLGQCHSMAPGVLLLLQGFGECSRSTQGALQRAAGRLLHHGECRGSGNIVPQGDVGGRPRCAGTSSTTGESGVSGRRGSEAGQKPPCRLGLSRGSTAQPTWQWRRRRRSHRAGAAGTPGLLAVW